MPHLNTYAQMHRCNSTTGGGGPMGAQASHDMGSPSVATAG